MEIAKLILEYAKVFAWPITVIFLGFYFRKSLVAILARLERATLPGGISLDFEKKIQQIEALSEKVSAKHEPKQLSRKTLDVDISPNKIMVARGLMPVQSDLRMGYFQDLLDESPALAVASVRIEIEILAKNIIAACKLSIPPENSLTTIIKDLFDNKVIDQNQFSLATKIVELCNLVIHGKRVSRASAEIVLRGVSILYLDYIVWLSKE